MNFEFSRQKILNLPVEVTGEGVFKLKEGEISKLKHLSSGTTTDGVTWISSWLKLMDWMEKSILGVLGDPCKNGLGMGDLFLAGVLLKSDSAAALATCSRPLTGVLKSPERALSIDSSDMWSFKLLIGVFLGVLNKLLKVVFELDSSRLPIFLGVLCITVLEFGVAVINALESMFAVRIARSMESSIM